MADDVSALKAELEQRVRELEACRRDAELSLRASEQLSRGQASALKSAVDALASEPDVDQLTGHILRTTTEQFGAHSSSVWSRAQDSGMIRFEFAYEGGRVVTKEDRRFAGLDLLLPMEDLWPWPEVFRTGKASVIEDIRDVPPFPLRDRLLPMGIITVLLVPMYVTGRLEGAIGLRFAHKRGFRPEEIELAQALASQVMLALLLARLSAQIRDSAVLAERNRMARDIHDTLAQGFTGVIVQLEAAEDARSKGLISDACDHAQRAAGLAREGLKEARRSVLALRPQALEESSLCEALDQMLRRMTEGTGLQAEFVVQGEPRQLPAEWEENFLHIGQEVLTNVLRHAQANEFRVRLSFEHAAVHMDLVDNGRGFDPAGKNEGFGLRGIKERVQRMGGRITIQGAPVKGTAISIGVPQAAPARSA